MNRRRLLTVMLCVAICFAALFSLSACGGDNGKALSVAKSHFENGSDFYKIVYGKGRRLLFRHLEQGCRRCVA